MAGEPVENGRREVVQNQELCLSGFLLVRVEELAMHNSLQAQTVGRDIVVAACVAESVAACARALVL